MKVAKEEWKKVKTNNKECREKYLLDYHYSTIEEINQNKAR